MVEAGPKASFEERVAMIAFRRFCPAPSLRRTTRFPRALDSYSAGWI